MRAGLIALCCAGCLPYAVPDEAPDARPARHRPPLPVDRRVPVIEAPVSDPTITKPPIVVRVLDRVTGAPVEGAEVHRDEAFAWTDADGFAAVAATRRPWRVTATGYVSTEFTAARPQVLHLQPARPADLRVTDLSGTPILEARVRCVERHSRRETARSEWGFTGHAGLAHLPDVAPGPAAEFEVTAPGWFTLTVPAGRVRADRHGRVLRLDTPAPVADDPDHDDPDREGTWLLLHRHGGHEPVPGFPLGAALGGRPGRRRLVTGMDGRAHVWGRGRRLFLTAWDPFTPLGLDPEQAECGPGEQPVFHLRRRPTVRLERGHHAGPVSAMLVALGRTTPVRWGRRQHVPGDVELAVRLTTDQADLVQPLGRVPFETREKRFTVRMDPVAEVAPWAARPAAVAGAPDRGRGRLTVSVRDYRGRFVSGSVSLDGAAPKRGARIDYGEVAAGPHRVVVWARGREARVHAVAVEAGADRRVVLPLARAR